MTFRKSMTRIVSYTLKNERHQTLVPVPYNINLAEDCELESYVRKHLSSELGNDQFEDLIII